MISKARVIAPHAGPQETALASPADILIYGGAAGGGKSFGLVLDPIRHSNNKDFRGVIFRRTSPQLTGAGSIWEEAEGLYRPAGAWMPKTPNLRAVFQSGATIHFLHLQRPGDVHNHQGKQYAYIGFDELTHFTESQFWYMVSRMRSKSGVRPYMRSTCNPDPDSFVRDLIDWWIGEDGYPILHRSGQLRWFVRHEGVLHWGDSKEEMMARFNDPGDPPPLSFTFVAAKLEDNPTLMTDDPSYMHRLMSLPDVERERLLKGNWNIRPSAGKYIQASYLERRWDDESDLPEMYIYTASDFAVTEPREGENDPDYTEHGVFGVDADDDLYVLDWWYGQTAPDEWIERLIDLWAKWEPFMAFGEGGVIRRSIEPFLDRRMRERQTYVKVEWVNAPRTVDTVTRAGFDDRSKRAKAVKGRAFQARAAMGKVLFPTAKQTRPWVERVTRRLTSFPYGHDDAFDVCATMCMGIDSAVGAPRIVRAKPKKRDRWAEAFARNKQGSDWKIV